MNVLIGFTQPLDKLEFDEQPHLPLPLGELPAQRIKIAMIAGGNHTKMYQVPP